MTDEPVLPPQSPEGLQFDRAESKAASAGLTCAACRQPIVQTYYTAQNKTICGVCENNMRLSLSGGSGARRFLRATILGTLAAALGSGIYFAISALTGYEFGLVAIIVGLLVGAAVRRGSQGRGGWAYQALAIFLTYSAIVTTYMPAVMKAIQDAPVSETAEKPPEQKPEAGSEQPGFINKAVLVVVALAILFAIAFIVPFMGGTGNIMGLIIIGIALYEAWKINKRTRLALAGPFRISPAAGDKHAGEAASG